MERNHLQGIKWVLHICLASQLTPLEYDHGRVKVTTCRNQGAHCGSLLISIRKVDLLVLPRSTNMAGLCRQSPKSNTGLIHVEESFRVDVVLLDCLLKQVKPGIHCTPVCCTTMNCGQGG